MQRISRWLQDCQIHPKCKKEVNHVLPSRVLDIGTSAIPHIRLRITNEDEKGKYAALSYCWGGYTGFMLKQHNMADFQHSIDEISMPQTYKDAILLCRRLGIQYLWIDALCILQDSKPDWELENPRMAEVYGNAYLTISATSARSATQGFLSPRDAIDVTSVLIGKVSHHDETYPVYLSEPLLENIRDVELHIQDEPLTSRAWALQERMLSQRVVHFASKGMLWQCRQYTINEDDMNSRTDVMMVPYMKSFKSPLLEWYRIADRFSRCTMTVPTDCFPAFAGITKAF
ncbi:HET-domain-containing protein, partial [Dissoconium aciculare CBS 342.82]|uniref:HET-domain-containing protein n=1 Tax=Dissoconium aciculare CBS 342.82 TaxID=1314786 RepID=A0A6J3MFA3_9PEZI